MFQKAVKQQLKGRIAIFAPSGGGKTWTSLVTAGALGGRIAYIDTENDSASKYIGEAGIPEFDVASLPYNADAGKYVRKLIDMISYAQDHYDVLVVDSLTHAWSACKDEVDAAAKRMRNPNSFAAWKEGSTLWGQLIAAILNCRCHIICCARSKTEWVQEKDDRGKTTPKKIGMAPELRDGMEYEFDIVAEMDQEHNLIVTKTRCHAIDGLAVKCPGKGWIAPVIEWLGAGVAPPPPAPPALPGQAIVDRFAEFGVSVEQLELLVNCERAGWTGEHKLKLTDAGTKMKAGWSIEEVMEGRQNG